MIDAQNLNDISLQSIGDDIWRLAFRSRLLFFAVPGAAPLFDPLMWNPLAAIERSHSFLNAGDLQLVQVEVLVCLARGLLNFTPPSFLL